MDRSEKLAEVLGEYARTMLTDFPIQTILDRLVARIVDVLPVTAAGVTLISDGTEPRYVSASDAAALTRLKGEANASLIRLAMSSTSLASLRSSHRITNSSPDTRARVSPGRSRPLNRRPTAISNASPTGWPCASLTCLQLG